MSDLNAEDQNKSHDMPDDRARSNASDGDNVPIPRPKRRWRFREHSVGGPIPQIEVQSDPEPEPNPKPESKAELTAPRQAQEKRRSAQIPRTYLKSASLKQGFRNLTKLSPGAAWREVHWPLIIFLVLFACVALAVVDAFPMVDEFNASVEGVIHGVRGMMDPAVIMLTTCGNALPLAGVSLFVCLILLIARKWDSLAFFVVNIVLAVIFVHALKFIFAIPRPVDETLIPLPMSYSFPSAHSFCSLVVYGMIGLLIYRAMTRVGAEKKASAVPGIILVIFAILIGLSRIYVGVHWPSDVLGAWFLAGAWLMVAGGLYTVGSRVVFERP